MFKKVTLNQEFRDNFKEDAKNLFYILLFAAAIGIPITYMIYRPYLH